MKINHNQIIVEDNLLNVSYNLNQYFFGNYVNVYVWVANKQLLFWEDSYFQLMASMRKMRISIPESFTPEYFENQIEELLQVNQKIQGTVKITVFNLGNEDISFVIEILPYKDFLSSDYNDIDIYKDLIVFPDLLNSLYVFQPLNQVAKKYATENDLQELIILNPDKNIARSIEGNIFLLSDNEIITNTTEQGAYLSVLKKNFKTFLQKKTDYILKEEKILPYQTQSAQEVFILSDKNGLLPIHKIRNKTFETEKTALLAKKFVGFAML